MLANLIEQLTQFVESIVVTFGLAGIGMIAVGENLFPPTPSEFIYPLAGKMAFDGELSIVGIVVIGVLGTLLASSLWYLLGQRLGQERIRQAIERYGTLRLWKMRIELFSVAQFDHALTLFERHGPAIVIVARVLPYVHSIVSLPAGVIRMSYPAFLVYTAIGSMLWILPLTLIGYALGSRWRDVLTLLDTYQTVFLIAAAALVAYWLVRRWLRGREAARTS